MMILNWLTDLGGTVYNFFVKPISDHLGSWFVDGLINIGLYLDRMVYNLITKIYSVFLAIGSSQLVSSDAVQLFTTRVYTILSVVMLFILAYSFMNVIINPDNSAKGNSNAGIIVRNTIIALLSIVFIPAVFRFGYAIQNSIIKDQVINKIIMGTKTVKIYDDSTANKYGQSEFAVSLFESNFYLTEPRENIDCSLVENDTELECKFAYARELAINIGDVEIYSAFFDQIKSGDVEFNFLLSIILGIFTLYVLAVYCFDIALRAIKLFMLELIAPIPALFFIVPGQSKVFVSWIKATLKSFVEIFLKIAILSFSVYFINLVVHSLTSGQLSTQFSDFSNGVKFTAQAFIIFGIVLFIKQAPSLLSDIFGIKMEKGSLSLKKRLTDSGALAAFGLGAGGLYAFAGGYKGSRARGRKFGKNVGSGFASLGRGALTGARAGFKGNFKGMGAAYSEAMDSQLYRAKRGKTGIRGIPGVISDQLRDNLGIDSVYDEEVKLATIESEEQMRRYKQSLRSMRETSRQKINDIQSEAKKANGRNHQGLDSLNAALDKNKEETYKAESKTEMEVSLPTIVDYKSSLSKVGADVGDILTGLGVDGTFDFTDDTGTVHRRANYSSIRKGIEVLEQRINSRRGSSDSTIETINNELAALENEKRNLDSRDPGNLSRLDSIDARRKDLMDQLNALKTGNEAADQADSAQRDALLAAIRQIEAMRDVDKNSIVMVSKQVNASKLQAFENNMIDMFTDAGYEAATAAELATQYSQQFKESYEELLKLNASKDLQSGEKSKLLAELLKFKDILSSSTFGHSLTVNSKGDPISTNKIDSSIESLVRDLSSKDVSAYTGEELYKMLSTLKALVGKNDIKEQDALRSSPVTITDLDGKKKTSTLSRIAEEMKDIEDVIKKAEEDLKNKQQAYEDHKNNLRSRDKK